MTCIATYTAQDVEFEPALLNKYNQSIPRYTSYPPATELKADFPASAFAAAIAVGNQTLTPLSLYCHIPFCTTACYFCGCNTIITQQQALVQPYLDALTSQITQVAALVNPNRQVNQLHWGGGTPNYLNREQISGLWFALQEHFQFAPAAEISIEVNPRYVNREDIFFLRNLGFNRISFGIQDFNLEVQTAVNRLQPEAMLFDVMRWIREAGFFSVNVDLIYGLPYQTLSTYTETIEKTLELNPDRIALFNFAYVPWLKPLQRKLQPETLPNAAEKLKILQMAITQLTAYGYAFIGMDHFAKPQDELTLAQQRGQLHRNFQGYTTQPESDLFGFGISAISMLQDVYIQNHKRLPDYYGAIHSQKFPIAKGLRLSADDLLRRAVIRELMCQFQFSFTDILSQCPAGSYPLGQAPDFEAYFAPILPQLDALAADGLIRRHADGLTVTGLGRLLVRNIAAVFDAYLDTPRTETFSKAI